MTQPKGAFAPYAVDGNMKKKREHSCLTKKQGLLILSTGSLKVQTFQATAV